MFQIASLLLMPAVMLISCNGDEGDGTDMNAGFYVSADKNVIQNNNEDAAVLQAQLDGKDVTSATTFYLLSGKDMTPISGHIFTTADLGEHQIVGSYGTFNTMKEPTVITAINVAVPSVAADPDAANTSFVHRAFLNQYTGTGCGYCPGMIRALRAAFEDEETADMAVLAAVHSYGAGDPAYIASPRASSYPFLHIDMVSSFSYDQDPYGKSGVLKSIMSERTSSPAKVGISANPFYKDDLLVVTVEVKAAVSGEYNLGVWFLQDNVYGQQTDNLGIVVTDKSYEYHHNCVRVADSRHLNTYAGHPLGKLEAGKTVQKTFVLNIKKDAWKLKDMNNIHFAAFVTERNGNVYEVVNVVDCPYNEPTPYQYR